MVKLSMLDRSRTRDRPETVPDIPGVVPLALDVTDDVAVIRAAGTAARYDLAHQQRRGVDLRPATVQRVSEKSANLLTLNGHAPHRAASGLHLTALIGAWTSAPAPLPRVRIEGVVTRRSAVQQPVQQRRLTQLRATGPHLPTEQGGVSLNEAPALSS
ncbi:hypothetical protein Pth03_75870 [Planotetraspora thailandica]|uniref:Uncharacterized protein n=1 Tax=Planotetraspora thailandica TaxID=487172 RepID=A0A8J3Y1L5_9ACTN|nr:hypothetical protein Pth03_75870 [Planotetraspora thailandica]